MATSDGTGADARLNSSPVTPPAGDADRRAAEGSRAWLNGIAWLNGLTEPERATVLGVFEAPKVAATAQACTEGVEHRAPAHADALLDIAREIRAWGSIGIFGAADRLEALAQEVAKQPALTRRAVLTVDPDCPPSAEQVELAVQAACQIQSLMRVLIREADEENDSGVILSVAVRTRELGRLIAFGLEDNEDVDTLHREVFGTERAVEVAS